MEYLLSAKVASGFLYLPETGSTNKDLLAKAQSEKLEEFFVIATDHQLSGRGRLDRSWQASPGSSVMASILLRPSFQDSNAIGWIPLMTAVAVAQSLEELGVKSLVKWPNDVLIADKKVSGILAEASADLSQVVVGFGINVVQRQGELPVETATSLFTEIGSELSKDQILSRVIANLKELYQALASSKGNAELSGLRQLVLDHSATVGKQVRVLFPDLSEVQGLAVAIDLAGRLQVQTNDKTLTVSAGDVLHLRSL